MASDVTATAAASNTQSVSLPPDLARIADAWTALPPHIREAILTLVGAGLGSSVAGLAGTPFPQETPDSLTRTGIEKVARRIAKKCRHIVQACLREEEWLDADAEFFRVISSSLNELGPCTICQLP